MILTRGIGVALLLCSLSPARGESHLDKMRARLHGGAKAFKLAEIDAASMDRRRLTPRARLALALEGMNWRHAQTKHFVLHYERKTFATRVGRMAEYFYEYIGGELKADQDRMAGRSHIFIFRKPEQWRAFIQRTGVQLEWAFSMVEGTVMYLQRADDKRQSADVLAHETTHLVIYRFFQGAPPLWLNEGLAEWYEEFGYAAFKGVKKSRKGTFKRMKTWYPLTLMTGNSTYPADQTALRLWYQTAKYLVGYLMIEYPPEKLIPFTNALIQGQPVNSALSRYYGIPSVTALEKDFEKFIN